ncbi:hypothetical protein FACS1894216_04980 [Synergistales bacterium]|nr:hypothetical protein FACS1894216_04980 [Synergistales bacterium]
MSCRTCMYHSDDVCENEKSMFYRDFRYEDDRCEKWETHEMPETVVMGMEGVREGWT